MSRLLTKVHCSGFFWVLALSTVWVALSLGSLCMKFHLSSGFFMLPRWTFNKLFSIETSRRDGCTTAALKHCFAIATWKRPTQGFCRFDLLEVSTVALFSVYQHEVILALYWIIYASSFFNQHYCNLINHLSFKFSQKKGGNRRPNFNSYSDSLEERK